ncbi:unnamed protein product [Boreogadus saida]
MYRLSEHSLAIERGHHRPVVACEIDSSVEDTVAKDNLTDTALNIGKILSCAEGNTKKAQEKMKRMSLKSSVQKFNVGDMVWRLNIRSRQRKGGKLDPNFLGPYTVSSVENKSADSHPPKFEGKPQASRHHSGNIHPSSHRYSTSIHPSSHCYSTSIHASSHRYSTSIHASSHRYSTSIHPSSHRYSTSIHPSIPSHRPSNMFGDLLKLIIYVYV